MSYFTSASLDLATRWPTAPEARQWAKAERLKNYDVLLDNGDLFVIGLVRGGSGHGSTRWYEYVVVPPIPNTETKGPAGAHEPAKED